MAVWYLISTVVRYWCSLCTKLEKVKTSRNCITDTEPLGKPEKLIFGDGMYKISTYYISRVIDQANNLLNRGNVTTAKHKSGGIRWHRASYSSYRVRFYLCFFIFQSIKFLTFLEKKNITLLVFELVSFYKSKIL